MKSAATCPHCQAPSLTLWQRGAALACIYTACKKCRRYFCYPSWLHALWALACMSSFYIFAEREKLPPAANTIFFCTAVATTVGVLLFAPARMLTRAEQTQNNWDWLRQLLFYLALIAIAVWWVAASGIY